MSFKEARELVEIFEERSILELGAKYSEYVESEENEIKNAGIQGLEKLEYFCEKVNSLLESNLSSLRKKAVEYLGKFGRAEDYVNLIPLIEDPDDTIGAYALEKISFLTTEDFDFREYLKNPSSKLRKTALEILKEELSNQEIREIFTDQSQAVRESAVSILIERTEDKEFLKASLITTKSIKLKKNILLKLLIFETEFAIQRVREILFSSISSEKEKIAISGIIKEMPFEKASELLNEIMARKEDFQLITRLIPVYVSVNEEKPSKVISMMETFLKEENIELISAAIKGLGKLEEPSTVELMRPFLDNPEEKIKSAAIDALAKILDYTLTDRIEEFVKDPSKIVRRSAVKAIAKLKLQDNFYDIIEIIANKKEDETTRKTAINLCGKLKIQSSVPVISRVILDREEAFKTRTLGARMLLRISPDAVMNTLKR